MFDIFFYLHCLTTYSDHRDICFLLQPLTVQSLCSFWICMYVQNLGIFQSERSPQWWGIMAEICCIDSFLAVSSPNLAWWSLKVDQILEWILIILLFDRSLTPSYDLSLALNLYISLLQFLIIWPKSGEYDALLLELGAIILFCSLIIAAGDLHHFQNEFLSQIWLRHCQHSLPSWSSSNYFPHRQLGALLLWKDHACYFWNTCHHVPLSSYCIHWKALHQ